MQYQMQQAHQEAMGYVDGFAVHWYWDDLAPPSLLDKTHNLFPDKFLLNTESCLGMPHFYVFTKEKSQM